MRKAIVTATVMSGRVPRSAEAVAGLLVGSGEALEGFSEAEAPRLEKLLERPIANLDRIAACEAAGHLLAPGRTVPPASTRGAPALSARS